MGSLMALLSFLNAAAAGCSAPRGPRWVNAFFGKAQICSSGYMGFAHGLNDAQKTMGIIALALVSATRAGALDQLPAWLQFPAHRRRTRRRRFEIAHLDQGDLRRGHGLRHAAGGWRIIRRSATRWSSCIRSTVSPPKRVRRRCCRWPPRHSACRYRPRTTSRPRSWASASAKSPNAHQMDRGRAHGLGVDPHDAAIAGATGVFARARD